MRHAPYFRCAFLFLFVISLAACGDGMSGADAGDAGGRADSGRRDSGPPPRPDAGPRIDGGPTGCTEGCEIVELALGVQHSCGRRENGEVLCWGRDEDGQLGDRILRHDNCAEEGSPQQDCSAEPVNVQIDITALENLDDATRIIARGYFAGCAIRESTELWCWGLETLPTGAARRERQTAEQEEDLTNVLDATLSSGHLCYVVGKERAAFCYGANDSRHLGADTTLTPVRTPAPPVLADLDGDETRTALTGVDQIVAAGENTCALVDGGVWCWGADDVDQLGDNEGVRDECTSGVGMPYACTDAPVNVVTDVGPLTGVTQIDISGNHGCARTDESTLYCWGDNRAGQLTRLPDDATVSLVAVPVADMTDITQVAVGSLFTCALHATGSVSCWGWNRFGSLGDGIEDHADMNCMVGTQGGDCSIDPVTVATIDDATFVDASGDRACVIREGGSVWCWGYNDNHEAGHPSREAQFSPVRVAIPE